MAQLFFGASALAAFIALFGLALVPVEMSLATDMAIVCVLAVLPLSLSHWAAPALPDTPGSYTATIFSSNCTGLR